MRSAGGGRWLPGAIDRLAGGHRTAGQGSQGSEIQEKRTNRKSLVGHDRVSCTPDLTIALRYWSMVKKLMNIRVALSWTHIWS